MRTTITATIIAISLLACAPAQASTTETCTEWSEGAEAIMQARQSGMPMSEMMRKVEELDAGPFAAKLVEIAYDTPRYSTERFRQDEIRDFGDLVFSTCYEQLSQ